MNRDWFSVAIVLFVSRMHGGDEELCELEHATDETNIRHQLRHLHRHLSEFIQLRRSPSTLHIHSLQRTQGLFRKSRHGRRNIPLLRYIGIREWSRSYTKKRYYVDAHCNPECGPDGTCLSDGQISQCYCNSGFHGPTCEFNGKLRSWASITSRPCELQLSSFLL